VEADDVVEAGAVLLLEAPVVVVEPVLLGLPYAPV